VVIKASSRNLTSDLPFHQDLTRRRYILRRKLSYTMSIGTARRTFSVYLPTLVKQVVKIPCRLAKNSLGSIFSRPLHRQGHFRQCSFFFLIGTSIYQSDPNLQNSAGAYGVYFPVSSGIISYWLRDLIEWIITLLGSIPSNDS